MAITIPAEIVNKLQLVKGEKVKITLNQDQTLTVDPNIGIEDKVLDDLVDHALTHYSETLSRLAESDD
ncbi:hypothetical protein RA086_12795 [Lactiplantibacillus sp. WILCCON 0030]|uniref:SpoVT-AbrB domain-containing protein n=1 Tax=Lactiplantibacillus brownii TaxID=3069269 RepID=A0ABU1AC15_9LACO|nr:AbrB/MazE/SpoVT family DNA-binding domain-containing protein [Lactiplantibacillus brownii]MDQ7938487.1 hypothetical protein [Lactiplantibacillus brownii]